MSQDYVTQEALTAQMQAFTSQIIEGVRARRAGAGRRSDAKIRNLSLGDVFLYQNRLWLVCQYDSEKPHIKALDLHSLLTDGVLRLVKKWSDVPKSVPKVHDVVISYPSRYLDANGKPISPDAK